MFMRSVVAAGLMVMTFSTSAMAENIGVAMAYFDDNFLTVMRQEMGKEAQAQNINIQFADAQGDVGKQLNQVQNFVAQKVDAIIVNPADTAATPRITKMASAAGIPLVYVNRMPDEKTLPDKVVFVGSDEKVSGTLQAEQLAKMMDYKGNVAIMIGELATNASELRTKGVEDVVAKYPDMQIVQKQTANFQRNQAIDLMNNWIVSGEEIDAVASNNDEMALGALIAMRQAGIPSGKILVGGIDGTADALAAMESGDLAVTVYQDAKGQGKGAVEAAIKLAHGQPVEKNVWIPFELVTRENYKQFMNLSDEASTAPKAAK